MFLATVGLVALVSPVMASWWGIPAAAAGLMSFILRGDRRGMLLVGCTLWLLALTGLPIAGRPVPLLSTALAFAGTRALHEWSAQRRAARLETAHDEVDEGKREGEDKTQGECAVRTGRTRRPPSSLRPSRRGVSAGLVLGLLAWTGGLVGAVTLTGTWTGQFQIFPGLDIALAGAQLGTAAGLAAAIDSPRSRLVALVPLGLSLISLGMLFWLFFLSP
ncbi:MAG: hypothetical protein Q8P31_06950 [Bacillota bacterium]|nr:hypothetical protein [Bacillota bacterium]